MNELTPRARKIREAIAQHIDNEYQNKAKAEISRLKKAQATVQELQQTLEALTVDSATYHTAKTRLEVAEDQEQLAAEKLEAKRKSYQYSTRLRTLAKNAKSRLMATHPAKASYAKAELSKTTSLYISPKNVPFTGYVTSHSLKDVFRVDSTGDAASIPGHTFLQNEFENTSFLELIRSGDKDMLGALSSDPVEAQQLANDFLEIFKPKTTSKAAHLNIKQILWLAGENAYEDERYVVLCPLYPTHLSAYIHAQIHEDKFGSSSREAKARVKKTRQAFWNNTFSPNSFTQYPALARTKLGGAQPQNASVLLSSQRGANYHFPGLPPVWKTEPQRPLYGHKSLFIPFGRQRTVRRTINAFRRFLESDPPSNLHTRRKVVRFTNQLIDALVGFVASYQTLEPGWTKHAYCQLPREQQAWLDPWRAVKDDRFYKRWITYEWVNVCGQHFASWLNHELGKTLAMGDIEHRHWRNEFDIEDDWTIRIERSRKTIPTLEQEVSS